MSVRVEFDSDCCRVFLTPPCEDVSNHLHAVLWSVEIARARHLAEEEFGDVPHFVVADERLPLCEEMLNEEGLWVYRRRCPGNLRFCADIMVDLPDNLLQQALQTL